MIRCIALDDEPLALQQIGRFIERIPDLELVGLCYTVDQAREYIDEGRVDLLFLDIEMPEANGVDFARSIEDKNVNIIFVTAYPEFAIDGFRLDAVDYLLKPLNIDEMCRAIEKVKRRRTSAGKDMKAEKAIYVKASGAIKKLPMRDILYVKGLGEYVQIYMKGDPRPVVTYDSMKRLSDQLQPFNFMRVHKSYIINLNALDSASSHEVRIGEVSIPIGVTYRTAFATYIKNLSDKTGL